MTQAPALHAKQLLRAVFALAIAAAGAGTCLLVLRLFTSQGSDAAGPAIAGLLLGAIAADGFTGLVHWACDTWGSARTPLLGPGLIHSFREHHVDPDAMLRHDWIEVNREPGLVAALALALFLSPPGAALLSAQPFLHGFLCTFVAYGAAANQLHCWAHAPSPPALVRRLQACGLVLSPSAHARHHRAPNTEAYCISSGWLNPVLDATGFWRGLERVVTRTLGLVPRAPARGSMEAPLR
jgi:ubiquitin-conjugating enzyme E2 variant